MQIVPHHTTGRPTGDQAGTGCKHCEINDMELCPKFQFRRGSWFRAVFRIYFRARNKNAPASRGVWGSANRNENLIVA